MFSQNNDKVGNIINPRSVIKGNEIDYYDLLYPFLCQYTHCSYGALPCYFNQGSFTFCWQNFFLLTYLLVIFVFTKVYEGVVTINGEDLDDTKTMKSYYNVAYDSLEFQMELIDYLIIYYRNKPKEIVNIVIQKYIGIGDFDSSILKIVHMLEKMKESLFDNAIGSLDKSEFIGGILLENIKSGKIIIRKCSIFIIIDINSELKNLIKMIHL